MIGRPCQSRATSTSNPRRPLTLRWEERPIGIERAPIDLVGGTLTEAGPSNVDMLAWFSENERHVCGGCNEKACVTLPGVLAAFCLACGAIWVDGVRIDASLRIAGSRPVNTL